MAKLEMKSFNNTAATPTPQTQFVQGAGRRTLVAPRISRVKSGDDGGAIALKLLLFGDSGRGKTYGVKGLLELGYKVLVVTTDLGGDGTLAFKVPMRAEGKTHLLRNLRTLDLNGYTEVKAFLDEPKALFAEIYQWDPDIIVWDGFSAFQQVDISEHVADMPSLSTSDKELPAGIEAGLFMNTPQWGMIKNATMRTLQHFLELNNKETGKVWHKIVTCLEGLKQKEGKDARGYEETKEPLLQGVAGRMANAGFDLVIRCIKRTARDEQTKKLKDIFLFQIKGENARSKSRGFQLEDEEPGDMAALWTKLKEQAGVVDGAIDINNVAPVAMEPAIEVTEAA